MSFWKASPFHMGLAGAVFALALGLAPVSAAGLMPLASHRAVYDLTLADGGDNKAPVAASGRIAFEFTGSACEGYVMNFRQLTELQPASGAIRVSDMRSSTYEGGDAKTYQFRTETVVNGARVEKIDGSAKKSSSGALLIDLSKPKKATLNVDKRVAFPTEQIERILDAARAGRSTLEMKVFDGSSTGKKVYNTLAVIGRPIKTPPTDKAARTGVLRTMRRWPVAVSYFDSAKEDSPPEYVLSFDLYENGVSGALKLNYGDFTLNGELTHFRLLPQTGCSK